MFACSALKANFLLTLSSGLQTVTLYEGSSIEPSSFSSSGPENWWIERLGEPSFEQCDSLLVKHDEAGFIHEANFGPNDCDD